MITYFIKYFLYGEYLNHYYLFVIFKIINIIIVHDFILIIYRNHEIMQAANISTAEVWARC